MSDSPNPSTAAASAARFMVRLSDDRTFGPADMALLIRWAGEGRVPQDATIESLDGAPPVLAGDHPAIRAVFSAPPTVAGPMMSPPVTEGPLSTLIPYRNGAALGAYYTGVFSLIPIFALLLGPIAFVLGILGLRFAARHPQAHGKVHAWVGIIMGAMTFLGNTAVIVIAVIAARH
jgi:hypothetical protein